MLNSTAIASGYAGRDPQGGTSDGSLFSKFSLQWYLQWYLQWKRVKEIGNILELVIYTKIKRKKTKY